MNFICHKKPKQFDHKNIFKKEKFNAIIQLVLLLLIHENNDCTRDLCK